MVSFWQKDLIIVQQCKVTHWNDEPFPWILWGSAVLCCVGTMKKQNWVLVKLGPT